MNEKDRELLDEVFDRFVDDILDGREADLESAIANRPDLEEEIREMSEMARGVVGRNPVPPPRTEADNGGDGPERFGDFRLIRRLGAGGMGVVYVAEQESLQRLVALKIVHRGFESSPSVRQRFEREAQSIARLRHPNIVTVFAHGEVDGTQFLAMELVPGEGLDEVLIEHRTEKQAVPPARFVEWGCQIADALGYAHTHGVAHRDVKPSNIRITPDGQAMLVDFGLALELDEQTLTETGNFQGSPRYASPEQIRGEECGPASDVYSLGVTLYECLAAEPPFAGRSPEQVFHKVLTREARPLRKLNSAISKDLETVIAKAMEKEPGERYATAVNLAGDLEAVLEFRPIVARAPGPATRAMKWTRRNPRLAAALLTAALAVVSVPVGLLWQRHSFAAERTRDAERLVARAAANVREHLRQRELSMAQEKGVRDNRIEARRRHLPRAKYDKLHMHESRLAKQRQLRVELFLDTLAVLRRAEILGANVNETARIRADLHMERWREAIADRPDNENLEQVTAARAQLAFLRKQVEEHDREGRHRNELTGGEFVLRISHVNPDTKVWLFEYHDMADLSNNDVRIVSERRMVPLPRGRDPLSLPLPPGTLVLRVVRPTGELQVEDLIVKIAGWPILDTMFVVDERGTAWRLAAVDGKRVPDRFTAERLLHDAPSGSHVFQLQRGDESDLRRGADLADLRLELFEPTELAQRGGVEAEVLTSGIRRTLTLPQDLQVRATGAPLFLDPKDCLVCPVTRKLPWGNYLAFIRSKGFADQRHFLDFTRRMPEVGGTSPRLVRDRGPRGFASLVFETDDPPYWIMDREVTCAEYLRFLNDRQTLEKIGESSEPRYYPREDYKDASLFPVDDNGHYQLPKGWRPDFPICGISWFDAQAYAIWRTDEARQRGEPWRFSLPTWPELSYAAASPGLFVWGDKFRQDFTNGAHSRPTVAPEPVLSYPIDESPMGIFDLAGSVSEWLGDDWMGEKAFVAGSWMQGEPERFLTSRREPRPPHFHHREVGFRLVARRPQ